MLKRFAQRTYIGALAAALGYSIFQNGGLNLIGWNVTLLILGVTALAYWLRAPRADLAPPLEGWLGWMVPAVPIFAALQMVRIPSSLLRVLSPARASILDSLENITHSSGYASFSITPAVTFVHLFRIIGYTLGFLLVRELAFRSWKQRSWSIVVPVVVAGALEAAFGLIQNVSAAVVQGTYLDRNHFAGLLEMALPLAIGYAIVCFKGDRGRAPSNGGILRGYLLIATAVLILAGLVVSLSKMGLIGAWCGLLAMAALMLWPILHGWKRWSAAAALLLAVVALVTLSRSDRFAVLFARPFFEQFITGEPPIWANTLRLFRAYPFFGSGLGTYGTAILKYQSTVVDRDFSHAHNDYLELLSESGGLGFLLLAAVTLYTFLCAVRATGDPDRNTRFLALGCVGAMTAIGVHSVADFNLHVPSNALVLAWIAATACVLPGKSAAPPTGFSPRSFGITLAGLLILYAPGWIFFETSRRNGLRVESWFCRFGICYTDQSPPARDPGSMSDADLLDALRRDAAAPNRWCELGESRLKSGRLDQAGYCFSTALTLAPYIPAILMRAAGFYDSIHDTGQALRQTSRILGNTGAYDDQIFAWYAQKNIPLDRILAGGLPDGRSAKAFLRSIYTGPVDRARQANQVWEWAVAHGYIDEPLARDYIAFLFSGHLYQAAARSWALYLGERRGGYLQSDWLYNGDFETQPTGSSFDWRIEPRSGVAVARDANVAHEGKHSLRIRFDGKENIAFNQIAETVYVTPARYRFEAYIRTEGITTNQGVGFHIAGDSGRSRVDVNTERLVGTNDWKKIEKIVVVPPGMELLQVQIVRQPSLQFDNQISGTVWIDSVKLVKLM
jgi:O-antigen ligase